MDCPINVLVVDDDDMVRAAYRAFFAARPNLELVGEAVDGAEGVERYGELRPDVVLMDLQMPRLDGIGAIGQITDRWPEARVVALTTFGTQDHIVRALRAGAAGYLVKDTGGDELAEAIEQAMAGEMPLSPAVRRELVGSLMAPTAPMVPAEAGLTAREAELLGWLAAGLSNASIGAAMYLSEGSVKQYLAHIADKLGTRSRTQILIRSIQLGVVDPDNLPTPEGS